jgi:hypothetical protein
MRSKGACVLLWKNKATRRFTYESQTVSKADVREVQDHPQKRQGYGHLLRPQAQAEAGLITDVGSVCPELAPERYKTGRGQQAPPATVKNGRILHAYM